MHVVSLCATDCSIAIPAPPPLRAASCSCSFSSLFCICCSCLFRSFIYIIEQWASTTCNINATFYRAGVLLLSSTIYVCPAERGGGSWNPSPPPALLYVALTMFCDFFSTTLTASCLSSTVLSSSSTLERDSSNSLRQLDRSLSRL